MPLTEFINLLSSDDEVVPQILNPSKAANANNFPFLLDDFDSTVHLQDDWPVLAPAKRRKLSSKDDEPSLPTYAGRQTFIISKAETNAEATNANDWNDLEEDDPIVLTSSAHHTETLSMPQRRARKSRSLSDASEDSLPDDIFAAAGSLGKLPKLSDRTAALLSSLNNSDAKFKSRDKGKEVTSRIDGRAMTTSQKPKQAREGDQEHNTISVSQPKKAKLTEEERQAKETQKAKVKEDRAGEREIAKAQKLHEKDEEKERRRMEREQKAREKKRAAEIADVNKARVDKKVSTLEMIVDLPASIDGSQVANQAREFLKIVGADVALYQSSIPNVVKWRRKKNKKWDQERQHYVPIPHTTIEEEKHVMCLMSGEEFASLAMAGDGDEDIETHLARLKSTHNDCVPIYLIEGLSTVIAKSNNVRHRTFQAEVNRQNGIQIEAPQPKTKRKQAAAMVVDESKIEDALLRLQVLHNCLIHQDVSAFESATWIMQFTQHISQIPYRQQQMSLSTGFCMENGQVKCGDDKDDTFIKMLQEVVRVTPPIARGTFYRYPSIVALMKAFREGGQYVLEDLQKRSSDNDYVGGTIGPAISKRLYKVFMGLDETSDDV